MNKLKILFLLHLPPPIHGSSVVGQYIKNSVIINKEFDCNYINIGTSKSINEIGKNAIGKIFGYITILWKVLINLITNRPNLCYFAITAKGTALYKDAFIVLLVKLFRVKLVYHFHNKGVSTRQNRFIDNLLYPFVFKNAETILLSKYLYYDIQSYLPITKIHICPNGIPEGDISSKDYNRNQEGIVKILFLSNLIKSKGVFVLLHACSILKQKGISFECNFIGGEGDISATQFQAQVQLLGLTHHVKYLGRKYGEDKNQAFKDADIFAFPTFYDYECFPLVILEAMQYKLPVVSTHEGGIRDIVENGKTGFLVSQNDIQEFTAKLENLIQNYEMRCKMGKAGREKFEDEFTLEKFEIRLTEILHQILDK